MKTNKKGISLIVLVITIIVMIILAAAIILSISGSDIRGKANEAVSSSDIASAKELVAVARSEWETDYDVLSNKYEHFGEYANKKLEEKEIESVVVSKDGVINIVYEDKKGNIAVIPEGFSISTVKSEQTIDDGLVILDKDGNEFVWVPVDDMNMFNRTTTYDGVNITNPGSDFTEPYKVSGDLIGEVAEHTAMCDSVQENGGFYIARYEAGKEGTDTVVSKKGATVWNKIPWGTSMTEVGTEGAVYRARQMYKGSKSVVSTLCYGVQWDSALQFISNRGKKDKTYVTDSKGKGYYAYDKDGKEINLEEVQVAGSNDNYALNNIYDMAGNISEWTMEAYSTQKRVIRGGDYCTNGTSVPASFRDGGIGPVYSNAKRGFRVTLYIK